MNKMCKILSIVIFLAFSVKSFAGVKKDRAFLQLKSDMWKLGIDFEYGPYGQDEYIHTGLEESNEAEELVAEELRAALTL